MSFWWSHRIASSVGSFWHFLQIVARRTMLKKNSPSSSLAPSSALNQFSSLSGVEIAISAASFMPSSGRIVS